ncbi:MAG: hypothetical protein EOO99_07530 [Pedobacter sp.]|nr:MAG: hypothetical protein EOO99_07530 [Pedobacter sp.]
MSTATLYQPFKQFDFKGDLCFLSGAKPVEDFSILPPWLIKMAGLTGEEQIKLLDESIRNYSSLKIPVNPHLKDVYLNPLEDKVEAAFEKGFAGVSALAEIYLFHWIGKLLYGFLYLEMQGAIRLKQLSNDGLNMSQGLMHKFSNLHIMLQGIYREVQFEDFCPWSISVFELKEEQVGFAFRDEINTLSFSLKFKNFGIIACLQDNGTNKRFHQEILTEIGTKSILEVQFEEIAARYFYSAYLFNRLPEYTIMPVNEVIYIDPIPLRGTLNKALFDPWNNKTYAQVLENFWKPWGHPLLEILKDPNQPLSYFENPHLPPSS